MNSLHTKLADAFPWYAKWHEASHISLFHFVVFTAFVGGSVLLLQNPLIETNQQLAAAIVPTTTSGQEYVPGQILVQFKAGVSDTDQADTLHGQSASIKSTIPQIHLHIVSVPVGAEKKVVAALAHNPRVQVADLDIIVQPKIIPNDPSYPSEWFSSVISEPTGWDITTGAPTVVVAVLDSGIVATPDMQNNIVPGFDFLTSSATVVTDSCNHGPAVAGIIANEGNNGQGIASIGWHVKVMPLTIANASLSCGGSYSAIAQAITYATDHGAKVINLSYGSVGSTTILDSVIQYAWNKNVLFFVSSGNDPAAPVSYPATAPLAIGVGATQQAATASGDTIATFSSHGSAVDLSAPGRNILTNNGAGFSGWSGTSFSSPMSAGLAALVFSVNPKLTSQQVVDLLEKNSDDLGTPGWDEYYGWGRIDVVKTLTAAQTVQTITDTTPPSATITAPTGGSTVLGQANVSVNAADNVAVTKVELYADGKLVGTATNAPYSFVWDATTVPAGTHTLSAKAYDAAGNVGTSASVSVTVQTPPPPGPDTTVPTVSITSPKNGAKVKGNGAVNISVTATDASGIASIAISADGTPLKTCANTTSCTASWSGKSITTGTHTITAVATDASANKNTSTTTVTINK